MTSTWIGSKNPCIPVNIPVVSSTDGVTVSAKMIAHRHHREWREQLGAIRKAWIQEVDVRGALATRSVGRLHVGGWLHVEDARAAVRGQLEWVARYEEVHPRRDLLTRHASNVLGTATQSTRGKDSPHGAPPQGCRHR
jgi:hypothetical protein